VVPGVGRRRAGRRASPDPRPPRDAALDALHRPHCEHSRSDCPTRLVRPRGAPGFGVGASLPSWPHRTHPDLLVLPAARRGHNGNPDRTRHHRPLPGSATSVRLSSWPSRHRFGALHRRCECLPPTVTVGSPRGSPSRRGRSTSRGPFDRFEWGWIGHHRRGSPRSCAGGRHVKLPWWGRRNDLVGASFFFTALVGSLETLGPFQTQSMSARPASGWGGGAVPDLRHTQLVLVCISSHNARP